MHLVMPWFLPLAALVAWLGTLTARRSRAEGGISRATAAWMVILMFTPLFCWLLVQVTTLTGILQ